MAKPEWGTKRICQSCAARFYDLNRQPIVCPSCGATFDLEVAAKPKRSRAAVPAAKAAPVQDDVVKKKKIAAEDDDDFDDDEVADDDEDETGSPIEDASELGEDDDVADVIDGGLEEGEEER